MLVEKFLVGSPMLDRTKGKGQMEGCPGHRDRGLGVRLTASSHKTICVNKANNRYWMENFGKSGRLRVR
jgi:hypothetical protein